MSCLKIQLQWTKHILFRLVTKLNREKMPSFQYIHSSAGRRGPSFHDDVSRKAIFLLDFVGYIYSMSYNYVIIDMVYSRDYSQIQISTYLPEGKGTYLLVSR